MSLVRYFVLVVVLSGGFCAPMTCPNVEDLAPCSCKRLAYGLNVVCANFNSKDTLQRAFTILKDYRPHTVLLHNLDISSISSTLFDGMAIKEMRVEKCNLSFSEPAFSGLDSSLTVLNVAQQSMIKSQERFTIAKLSRLNELSVQSNHLKRVDNTWLNDKVPNVHTLVLDNNDIERLDDKAFANLPLLKTLSLAENRVSKVERSMFHRPAALVRIDMSFNEIKDLPADFFEDMPNLREVLLSGNDLKILSEKTWSPVWQVLKQVLVFDNKIICDERLDWIKNYKPPMQLNGNCDSPENMKGKSIKTVAKK